jgi:hypothetical protein
MSGTMYELIKHILICTAFLLLAANFLVQSSFIIFGLSVLGFLLIAKWNVLFFPVYGDAASGPWTEALWLYQHHFDYVGLSQQPGFTMGGPKAYLFSLYPGFIAFLMNIFSNVKCLLFVCHFINFVLAALTVGLFREVLFSITTKQRALLVALLFFFLPISQAQIEILNMEIWALFFMMLSAFYLMQKNVTLAFMAASLAALIKVYAMSANLSVFAICLVLAIFLKAKDRWKVLLIGLTSLCFAVLIFKCESYFFPGLWKVSKIGVGIGIKDLARSPYSYFFIFSLIIFLRRCFQLKREAWTKNYSFVVMACYAGAWMVIFFNSAVIFPRYWYTIIPFVLFCFIWALQSFKVVEQNIHKSLIFLIVLVLFNAYGVFYPTLKGNLHSRLERSLEYRNELRLEQKLARTLQSDYSDKLIAAPFTIAQILAFPQLGYVSKSLNVMIYEYHSSYGGIKNFEGLAALDLLKTIWIDIETTDLRERLKGIVDDYPVSKEDKVIEKIEEGHQKAQLFIGGTSIEKVRRMMMIVNRQKVQ